MNLFKKSAIVIAMLAIVVSAGIDSTNSKKITFNQCIEFTINTINLAQKSVVPPAIDAKVSREISDKIDFVNAQLKEFPDITRTCTNFDLWYKAKRENKSNHDLMKCLTLNFEFFKLISSRKLQIHDYEKLKVVPSFQGLLDNCQKIPRSIQE